MRTLLLLAAALLAPTLLSAQTPKDSGPITRPSSPLSQDAPVSDTVSVPIHDGDPATVTGTLALHTRAGHQFLVIESPTPYRLVLPPGHLGTPAKVIRDIAFTLPGQETAITPFSGRTVTASGKLHIVSKSTPSWNGAVLESSTVILPGGQQLHAKH